MAEPFRGIQGAPAPDPQRTRNALKQARLRAISQGQALPRVRVLPANDDLRRILKHPRAMKFRSTGSVEWPYDKFTQRRLREGSITIEERPAPRSAHHHHHHPQPPQHQQADAE
jgi:hypothetical protein